MYGKDRTQVDVGDLLGLDGNSDLLDQARERWSTWVAADDRLAVVPSFDELRAWIPQACRTGEAGRDAADGVLLALAMLAAPDGGDDLAAAGALAKCLLPGACRLACWFATQRADMLPGGQTRLATELVASELWIQVRSFPWRRGRKVAANILMNTRAAVLRECGDTNQMRRAADQAWVRTQLSAGLSDPDPKDATFADLTEAGPGEEELSVQEELLAVLEWARQEDVITDTDRSLLLYLVEEASRSRTQRTTRGYGGLLANDVSARAADRAGMSVATVRRRAAKSMRALAAAAPGRFSDV